MNNKKTTKQPFSDESILSYLKGESDKETTRAIEEEMNNSMFFSDAMDGFAASEDIINISNKLSFDQIRTKKKSTKSLSISRIAAAAAMLLLPLAALLWWNNSSNNPEDLFAANYSHFPTDKYEITRGESPKEEKILDMEMEAYKAYAKKDYGKAISAFESYLLNTTEDEEAALYLGLSQLESGKTKSAIQNLETARINGERFYDDATWYLALAHIKNHQNLEAKLVLQDLVKNEKGHYFEQAQKLLASLRN